MMMMMYNVCVCTCGTYRLLHCLAVTGRCSRSASLLVWTLHGRTQPSSVCLYAPSVTVVDPVPVRLSVCLSVCFAVSLCLLLVERCSTVVD